MEFYKRMYNNVFAKDFETINDIKIVQSKKDYLNKIRIITNDSQLKNKCEEIGVFILYRIVNKEN